jgi:hypothetical protein
MWFVNLWLFALISFSLIIENGHLYYFQFGVETHFYFFLKTIDLNDEANKIVCYISGCFMFKI